MPVVLTAAVLVPTTIAGTLAVTQNEDWPQLADEVLRNLIWALVGALGLLPIAGVLAFLVLRRVLTQGLGSARAVVTASGNVARAIAAGETHHAIIAAERVVEEFAAWQARAALRRWIIGTAVALLAALAPLFSTLLVLRQTELLESQNTIIGQQTNLLGAQNQLIELQTKRMDQQTATAEAQRRAPLTTEMLQLLLIGAEMPSYGTPGFQGIPLPDPDLTSRSPRVRAEAERRARVQAEAERRTAEAARKQEEEAAQRRKIFFARLTTLTLSATPFYYVRIEPPQPSATAGEECSRAATVRDPALATEDVKPEMIPFPLSPERGQLLAGLLRMTRARPDHLADAVRHGAVFEAADLRGADLSGLVVASDLRLDLTGADLTRAVLRPQGSRSDIRWGLSKTAVPGIVLRNAVLRQADLRHVDLSTADLRGVDLREALLCSADLRGADLRNADLRGAILHGAKLDWAKLEGTAVGVPGGPLVLPSEAVIVEDPSSEGWAPITADGLVRLRQIVRPSTGQDQDPQ